MTPGVFGVAAMLVFCASGLASAQPSRQQFDLTVSLAQSWDDDAMADLRQGSVAPTTVQQAGLYSHLSGDLSYGRRMGRRAQLSAAASSSVRYYGSESELRSMGHSASVGASTRLFGRATLQGSQSVAYSPSYFYGLFPGSPAAGGTVELLPTAPDYVNNTSESLAYHTSVSLAQPVGRLGQVSVAADLSRTDYSSDADAAGFHDMSNQGMNARYSHRLGRRASMNVSYGYRVGDFGYAGGERTSEQTFGAGVAYTRPVSTSRSLSVSLNMGASTLEVPSLLLSLDSGAGDVRQRRISGDASLGYQFRRGWQATGSFRRGVEYVPDLLEPVYVDGISVGLTGRLSRRLEMQMTASYSDGESTILGGSNSFDTYAVSTSVQYPVARSLAVYGEYLYYAYDFGSGASLAPGVPSRLERNGVRAGLTWRTSPFGRVSALP